MYHTVLISVGSFFSFYQAFNDTIRRSDKAFASHLTCFPSNQNNSASPPTTTPDTFTIAPVSHK
ncbi:hypothetical protein, partial [Escherichia coli]|uniref:hypothetical protein n=1 Tax=Escherichia coli TaxID=562 RepID=UPI0025AE2DB4